MTTTPVLLGEIHQCRGVNRLHAALRGRRHPADLTTQADSLSGDRLDVRPAPGGAELLLQFVTQAFQGRTDRIRHCSRGDPGWVARRIAFGPLDEAIECEVIDQWK